MIQDQVLNCAVVATCLLALSAFASVRFSLPTWLALAAGLAAVGVYGVVMFWVAWLWMPLATLVKYIGMALAGIAASYSARRRFDFDLLIPCAAAFIGAIALLAIGIWFAPPQPDASNLMRFIAGRFLQPALPGDNEIPFVAATQLLAGGLQHPFYGDWLFSDRPPLQTGLYLLLTAANERQETSYEATCVGLQMFILPATWMLARAMGASRLWSGLSMLALWATPLVWINGVFVWPKLLAAAFLCIPAAILFAQDAVWSPKRLCLASVGAALAMLSHGATAFALIGIAIICLFLWKRLSVRPVIAAVTCFVVLYAPWQAFQKFVDPPGDRLLKMHLAGAPDVDPRPLSAVLAEKYSATSPDQWLSRRKQNFARVFIEPPQWAWKSMTGKTSKAEFRLVSFFLIPLGMSLFGFTMFALPGFVVWGPTRSVAASVLLGLAAWFTLMFDGGSAIAHQGSYWWQAAGVALAARVLSTRGSVLGVVALAVSALLTLWLMG